ncbi:MAG: hypothetical protein ACI8TL_000236 [Natronomonas sp.]|jgi:hypothetical protein
MNRAEQILRVVGPTLGLVGLALSWPSDIDVFVAVGKLLLVVGAVVLFLYAVFNVVEDLSDSA